MRLLLVVPDARHRSLIRHHITCEWPDADLTMHTVRTAGALMPPEFLAQGFDAVILDQDWNSNEGLTWLSDLGGRRGFAPVIFLADDTDSEVARQARIFGAFAVLGKRKVAHDRMIAVIAEAARVQRRARADWRVSAEAEQSRRFGAVRIPGYRCVRRLAGGTLSQLFLAESEKAGSLIVIKVTPSQIDASGIDQAFERFLQEYEIANRLRHPNIVHCHELGVADDHAYLAMEYFPDGDLRRRMRAGLVPAEALDMAAQIASALAALHKAGALHRDLKPGNVLMRGLHRIALSDFGLAKHAGLELDITDPGIIFGTPHYMSPEQGHGEHVDERSDLYSLGIILFEMLTGEKPFTDANPMAIIYKHKNQPIPRLPSAVAVWQGVVDKLLAKRPEDRVASALLAEVLLRGAAQNAGAVPA
jgi:eukaryotic-like serine/threonine-protein kinase